MNCTVCQVHPTILAVFYWKQFVCVLLIAIGFLNGMVRLVDSLSLEDVTAQPFNNTHREAITHVAFSHNCEYFATAVSCNPSVGDVSSASVSVVRFYRPNNLAVFGIFLVTAFKGLHLRGLYLLLTVFTFLLNCNFLNIMYEHSMVLQLIHTFLL